MPLKKIKGIWPLPGGVRSYVVTLRRILERVNAENPTIDQLVSWLKSEYKLSGDKAPYGYVRVAKDRLNFIREVDGRLKLVSNAEEFLKTSDNRPVFETLRERVLGFDEVLSILADGRRLSLSEVHRELVKRCNVDWKERSHQTMYRLYWLVALGYVDEENRRFYLTKKGIDAIEERPPPPEPPKPIDYYVKRSLDLIRSYPAINERAINEVKQHLEHVLIQMEDVRKLQGTVQDLQIVLRDEREKIKQLENLIGPSPVNIVIRKLGNLSELLPDDFEWQLRQAFEGLGFDAKWNGQLKDEMPFQIAPPGKPDVEVKALLAGDPYFVVVEGTKVEEERYQVTEVHGAVDHSTAFPGPPYKTCYRIVIAPRFKKGAIEACEKIDPKYPVMLLTCQNLLEILKFHLEVGGITQEELKHLFDKFNARGEIKPEYIEEWEKTVREQRKKLSLALDVYDILYSDKGFMWSRDIWRELKKDRSKEGIPCESLRDVQDILRILDTIGAVVVKPSPDEDLEKYDYKAALTPDGFRLRIRKLEETIRLHESKEPKRWNKLTSWMEDKQ